MKEGRIWRASPTSTSNLTLAGAKVSPDPVVVMTYPSAGTTSAKKYNPSEFVVVERSIRSESFRRTTCTPDIGVSCRSSTSPVINARSCAKTQTDVETNMAMDRTTFVARSISVQPQICAAQLWSWAAGLPERTLKWLAFRKLTSMDDATWRRRPARWHYLSTFR